MEKKDITDFVLKVEEISKVGLKYSKDPYAVDNYKELRDYTKKFLAEKMDVKIPADNIFKRDIYPTPNISVRTVIFDPTRTKVLLVQERMDGGWSLPGGWTELTLSPSESALKELREEAGAECKIVRLIGLLDRYNDLPTTGVPEYIVVFEGEIISQKDDVCHEIIKKDFFSLDNLPAWSKKNNPKQMEKILKAAKNNAVIFD